MDGRVVRLLTLILGLVSILAGGAVWAQTVDTEQYIRLGILPLANHTGRMEAAEVLIPGIHARLRAAGIRFLSADDLRPLLRENRIRSVGQIGAEAVSLIRAKTRVSYLLLGSLDIYDEQSLEVGLSLRILNTRTLELVKATSVAVTGEDFTGFFEIGRVTEILEVADWVLDRAFEKLGTPLFAPARLVPPDATRIAIIPLENMSEMPQANEIVANILLSNLLANGYVSVEPGFVNEVFLARRTMARGQVDLETLETLRESLAIDFTLTGVVDLMHPARGDLTIAVPSLTFGARLLEADSGRLRAAWEIRQKGTDGESFLGLGRVRSLGQLTHDATNELIRLLDVELDDRQPEGPLNCE